MANETLQLKKEDVLNTYNVSNSVQKVLLEGLFGKEVFIQKITDRVKTFEDALAIKGCEKDEEILLQYSGTNKNMLAAQAFLKLSIIRAVLNEDWMSDYDNYEYKYYPWFDMSGGGILFYDFSTSSVGAHLSFKSRELAEYAATQFIDLYKVLFII